MVSLKIFEFKIILKMLLLLIFGKNLVFTKKEIIFYKSNTLLKENTGVRNIFHPINL